MTETSLVFVVRPLIAAAFGGLIAASIMPADAAKRRAAGETLASIAKNYGVHLAMISRL